MFKTPLDKVMIVFTVFLAIFMAFSAGVSTEGGQWLNALSAAVSAVFFVAIVWSILAMRISSLKDEIRRSALKEIQPSLDKMVEAAKHMVETVDAASVREVEELRGQQDEHEQILAEMLTNAVVDVLGEPRKVLESDIPAIQKRFTELAGDHHVRIELEEDGMTAEFLRISGKIPVAASEDEGRAVPTHVAPEAKPLSKSQQRRVNSQKGLGALTDDEVAKARNEKRRAARAAKKASSVVDAQLDVSPKTTLKERVAAE